MALSNLVVDRLEQYGSIDLKKNYKKYFSNALAISIAMHLVIIMLFVGWTSISKSDKKHYNRDAEVMYITMPPPIQDKPAQAQHFSPPPPSNVAKPNLGVPIPVPEAISAQNSLLSTNQPTTKTIDNGPAMPNSPPAFDIPTKPATKVIPGIDDFVDLSRDPQEVQSLDQLIKYPEIARRSGLEGKVQIAILIGEDGKVDSVVVEKSDYDIFKDAAISAAKSEKFTPALQNKTPVSVWVQRTIDFKLNSK
jgi:periplasmic protein TonB